MCGITGIFRPDGGSADMDVLRRMTAALAHRGPDGDGFHAEPGLGLGHRRLAIIDPTGGEQPMFNEDGSVAIDFYVDTITAASSVTVPGTGQVISYPSGYGTLGPFGGDGFMVAGNANNIVTFSTSISDNLNKAANLPNKAALMPCRAPTSNSLDCALIGVGAPPRQAEKSTTL